MLQTPHLFSGSIKENIRYVLQSEYKDKVIAACEIPELDAFSKPCYYTGKGKMKGSYIRVGDADLPMTEYEIYSFDAF